MKNTVIILCLMIGLAGAGQTDSITFHPLGRFSIDTLRKYDTASFFALRSWVGGSGMVIQTHEPKYDTIPIIYLYADTTTFEAFGAKQRNPITYWDFGYEVRERTRWIDEPGTYCWNCPPYSYEHYQYLDRQKNPIRKGVIIWITKTIEK